MKASLLMILAGAACSLLMSCQTPDVHVTTKSGAPISGAVIEPAYVSFGCARPVYTDPCGGASLPRSTPDGAVYNVRKPGYRTVYGATQSAGNPNHIVMDVGWPK